MSKRIAVVGDVAADHYVWVAEDALASEKSIALRSEWFVGGTGANSAVAISRLGGRASLFSVVGSDLLGPWVREQLELEQVDCGRLRQVAGATTTALILYRGAARSIVVSMGVAGGGFDETSAQELADFDLVYCSYAPEVALKLARAGLGGKVVLGLEPWMVDSELIAALPQFLAVVMNSAGFAALGEVDPAATLVETRGAEGVRIHTRDGQLDVPAVPVAAVDATGAGDAFAGALVLHLAAGEGLAPAVGKAVQVGALATRDFGAQSALPRAAELS